MSDQEIQAAEDAAMEAEHHIEELALRMTALLPHDQAEGDHVIALVTKIYHMICAERQADQASFRRERAGG